MKQPVIIAIAAIIVIGGGIAAYMVSRGESGPNDPSNGTKSAIVPSKPHVILISIDTLRADRLSCYGYAGHKTPVMDALAEEGLLFENCFTPNPLTLPAHTSMLTGTSPIFHLVRDNTFTTVPETGIATMAEEFAANGYATAGFVSGIVMEKASGIARGFAHFDDKLSKPGGGEGLLMAERNAKDTLAAAKAWIDAQPKDKPLFVFIHLFDPHFPFDPPEPEFKAGIPAPVKYTPDELNPLYDAEIRYTDAKLGEFFASLKQDWAWDHAAIAITADHGEGLGDHGEMTHGYFIHDPTAHIPLIIKLPKAKAKTGRVSMAVTTTDLMRTLTNVAGVSLTELATKQQQGEDLMPYVLGERDGASRGVYIESHYGHNNAGWARLRAIRTKDSLAVIHNTTPELFVGADQHTNMLAGSGGGIDPAHQATYNAAKDRIAHLLSNWYNPNIRQVLRPSASGAYYSESAPGKGYNEAYHEGKPTAYGAEATPYPGESINRAPMRQESLADDEGLPSAHTKASALGLYQQAELLYSKGLNASALVTLRTLLETEATMLPALRLAARAEGNLANAAFRNREQSRLHVENAAGYANRAAEAADGLGLKLASLDVRASALLWELMLGRNEEVRNSVNDILEKHQRSMSVDIQDRYQRLLHMAAYRLAGADANKRREIGVRFSKHLANRRAQHKALIDIMEKGLDLPIAPWDPR